MILKTQTKTGPGGNCFQTCIASLLEIDIAITPSISLDVSDAEWWNRIRLWLNLHGWDIIPLDPEEAKTLSVMGIAVGQSPRGPFNHAVVWENGAMIHDPHPCGGGLVGEPKYVAFLIPRDPAKRKIRI